MNCPNCGHALSSAESQDGWCEQCGKKIPSSVGVTTSPRDAGPANVGPAVYHATNSDVLGWGTVRAGLAVVVAGLIFLIFSSIVSMALVAFEPRGSPSSLRFLLFLSTLLTQGLLGGAVLLLTGQCMSSGAPDTSGAKGPGFGVVFTVAMVLLFTLAMVLILPEMGFEVGRWVMVLGTFGLSIALWTCYVVHLGRVAHAFKSRSTMLHAHIFLFVILALQLLMFLLVLMGMTGEQARFGQMLGIGSKSFMLTLQAIWTAVGCWCLLLVASVRGIVTRGMLAR